MLMLLLAFDTMSLIRFVYIVQLAVMLPTWVIFVTQPASLGTLYLVVCTIALGIAVGLFAAWQARRKPAVGNFAKYSVLTTLFCVSTPFIIGTLEFQPLPFPFLIAATLVLAFAMAGLQLAKGKRWQPGKLFRGRRFNNGLLISIVATLVFIWVPVVVWLASGQGGQLGASQSHANATRSAFLIYYACISLPAVAVLGFSLLFPLVALLRNPDSRLIHMGQLAGSLVLLVSLGFVAGGIGLALVNPG
ncbi:MAG: hypothetical protein ACFHXK_22015 [bacterium]